MIRLAALFLALAAPALAQTEDDRALADVRACIAAETDNAGRACIGRAYDACRAARADGETTLGMADCAMLEARAWDRILNEEYAKTRAWAEETDLITGDTAPDLAQFADSLLESQRAWIIFRDAECRLAYAQWGTGSLRNIAGATCNLDMTANRAITLFELREGEGF